MKIAIAGASGLIGTKLMQFLKAEGHAVYPLKRMDKNAYEGLFEGVDAVINLAGAPVSKRWTNKWKQEIFNSRVLATKSIVEKISRMQNKPKVLINASAIGIYGDRGEQTVDEASLPGSGFLSEVVQAWEEEALKAKNEGVRVVLARFGIVLSKDGGALAKMLLPFKLCLGGRIGSGRQFMSWVAIDDAVGALHQAILDGSLDGPVNIVSPSPVRNEEFTHTLASVLNRPAPFPMPEFLVKIIFGEMGEILLTGARVEPTKLMQARYPFIGSNLRDALKRECYGI